MIQLTQYKQHILKFYSQDIENKKFMEFLEKKKLTNNPDLVIPGEKGSFWEDVKDMKNKVLSKIGKGEDIMLSHLAGKLAEKYVGEKIQVTDVQQYRSLFEFVDQQESVQSCPQIQDYKGRL